MKNAGALGVGWVARPCERPPKAATWLEGKGATYHNGLIGLVRNEPDPIRTHYDNVALVSGGQQHTVKAQLVEGLGLRLQSWAI